MTQNVPSADCADGADFERIAITDRDKTLEITSGLVTASSRLCVWWCFLCARRLADPVVAVCASYAPVGRLIQRPAKIKACFFA
jgi:hypothetical protein